MAAPFPHPRKRQVLLSPWLAVGSSVSHNVVFILGKVQGEILLEIVYFWVKGRGVKKGKYVLF